MSNDVKAAAIGALAALVAMSFKELVSAYRERRSVYREETAKAFSPVVSYTEYPFIIRRRRASDFESERIRISTGLADVQRDLAYHAAWLETHSPYVAAAYGKLVARAREIAGNAMRDAWLSPPLQDDAGNNLPGVGLSALDPLKEEYLREVRYSLSVFPRAFCKWWH